MAARRRCRGAVATPGVARHGAGRLAPLSLGASPGRAGRGGVAAGRYDARAADLFRRPGLDGRRQPRRTPGLRAGLEFRHGVFHRRSLLDRCRAHGRLAAILVADALCRAGLSGRARHLHRPRLDGERLRRPPFAPFRHGAGRHARALLVGAGICARPCLDRFPVEPDGLRLVGRVSRRRRGVAGGIGVRDLRAELPDRAGGLPAGAAGRGRGGAPLTRAGGAGDRRGAGGFRRLAARSQSAPGRAQHHLAPGPALDPADPGQRSAGAGRQFPPHARPDPVARIRQSLGGDLAGKRRLRPSSTATATREWRWPARRRRREW